MDGDLEPGSLTPARSAASVLDHELSILVVDDSPDVVEYLTDFLRSEGHSVAAQTDPLQALEILRQGDVQLAIIDLMMPGVTGIELTEQIRAFDHDIAIIILTGHPSVETASVSIRHEVAAYIQKPFDNREMRDAIHRVAKKKGLWLRREEELHKLVGKNLREARHLRQLTLKQLARRTRLSVSLLSQIERAESSASVASLYKVALALNMRLVDLLGGI